MLRHPKWSACCERGTAMRPGNSQSLIPRDICLPALGAVRAPVQHATHHAGSHGRSMVDIQPMSRLSIALSALRRPNAQERLGRHRCRQVRAGQGGLSGPHYRRLLRGVRMHGARARPAQS